MSEKNYLKDDIKYYILGYSDYIRNSLCDIINLESVTYYDSFKGNNFFERCIHRLFVSRYVHAFSFIMMPFWKNKYWGGKKPNRNDECILILYEINPLSNKIQWIKQVKKDFPHIKIVYIFTNIIDAHRMWRLNQINKHRDLYNLILTFNRSDAEKYNMTHYEGVFSAKKIDKKLLAEADECDVYFCGLDKGRLRFLKKIYDYLVENGVHCIFDIIYPENTSVEQTENFRYHSKLIDNDQMLANVNKAKCILEVMVDKSQPGSSLRMCESIAYKKKLITNNPFASEKYFFNKEQMRYFDQPEDIDIQYITKDLNDEMYLPQDFLSPTKFLEFLEKRLYENPKK